MKKLFNRLFDRVPILKYIVYSFVKWFIIMALACGVIFAVLLFTGIYAKVESALDLKYNSLFVVIPLYVFAGLSVLCFVIGFLLYFHKYKRTKSKSKFSKIYSDILSSARKN